MGIIRRIVIDPVAGAIAAGLIPGGNPSLLLTPLSCSGGPGITGAATGALAPPPIGVFAADEIHQLLAQAHLDGPGRRGVRRHHVELERQSSRRQVDDVCAQLFGLDHLGIGFGDCVESLAQDSDLGHRIEDEPDRAKHAFIDD